ncbi:hypothetical protein JCM14036_33930 [Desulfotomaculum defluvii]
MDIRINLLPQDLKNRFEQRKKQQRVMLLAAVICLIFICIVVGLQIAIKKINHDLAQLEQQKVALEKQVSILKPYLELQAKKEQVDNRVKKALGTFPDYPLMLEQIGLYLPPDIWLEEFSVGTDQKNGQKEAPDNEMLNKVNQVAETMVGQDHQVAEDQTDKKEEQEVSYAEVLIRGNALNNFAVANWLKDLEQLPQLKDIRCQSTAEEETAGELFTTFEIKAFLVVPKAAQSTGHKAGE